MAYGMLAPAGKAKNFSLRMLEELVVPKDEMN